MRSKPKKDILGYEEEDALTEEKKKKKAFKPTPPWYLILFVFGLALSVRLVFLFFFTEADKPPVGDVFHHWQIAYLTKTVGFKHGFLRLWDFKGMEYYWGLLHPLILIIGFVISRSVSIVVPRMVSTLFGCLSITVIFLILARHFNKKAALAGAVFLSLIPTAVFHETLGLQEPVGLFFLLLGIYLFDKLAFLAGFSWMLAGMVRVEYWLFGAGLVLAILIREKNFDRKVLTLCGYSIPCIFYLKYMLDHTGNPIYPLYWNFKGVVAGDWSPQVLGLSITLQSIRSVSKILTVLFFISSLVILGRKPKSYLFLLLGFANLTFLFFILGFSAYIYGFMRVSGYPGYVDKMWIGKLFAFPWGFLGILAAIFLFYLLPKKAGKLGTLLGALIFLVGLVATQLIWPSINKHYLEVQSSIIEPTKKTAAAVGDHYTGEGAVFLPPQSEYMTYFLVYNEKIPGEKLVSTFYDPFYYYQGEDPFSEWDSFREKLVEWLQKHDAELFIASEHEIRLGKSRARDYDQMLKLEEGRIFDLVAREYIYKIYKVKIGEE